MEKSRVLPYRVSSLYPCHYLTLSPVPVFPLFFADILRVEKLFPPHLLPWPFKPSRLFWKFPLFPFRIASIANELLYPDVSRLHTPRTLDPYTSSLPSAPFFSKRRSHLEQRRTFSWKWPHSLPPAAYLVDVFLTTFWARFDGSFGVDSPFLRSRSYVLLNSSAILQVCFSFGRLSVGWEFPADVSSPSGLSFALACFPAPQVVSRSPHRSFPPEFDLERPSATFPFSLRASLWVVVRLSPFAESPFGNAVF